MFQLLLYPVTDLAMDTDSYARAVAGVPLTARTMRWFVDHYAPRPGPARATGAPPRCAPQAWPALPPPCVLTVGHDPVADEGRAYAARLEAEGVPVTALHLADQVHGMLTMSRDARPPATAALQCAALALRDAWRVA